MKRRVVFLASSLMLLLLIAATPVRSFAEVHFSKMTFAEAEKAAVKQKKSVMIDFYTDWCIWCKVLDRSTYKNGSVGEYADEHFVSIKMNTEKEGKDLAKKYEVTGYPTILFVAADGKILNKVIGYQDSEAFLRSMTAAVEGGLSGLVARTESKSGSTDPKAWLTLADYYAGHNNKAEAIAAYEKVMALDPKDARKYQEQALYGKGFSQEGPDQVTTLEDAYAKYPDRPEARRAFMALMMNDFKSPNPERAGKRIDAWLAKNPDDPEAANAFAWEAAEHNILLDKAEEYASRAVYQYADHSDQANAIDTRAEVVAKEGRPKDAVIYETQAIAMLTPGQDDKRIKEFTERRDQFQKSADAAAQTQGTAVPK